MKSSQYARGLYPRSPVCLCQVARGPQSKPVSRTRESRVWCIDKLRRGLCVVGARHVVVRSLAVFPLWGSDDSPT